MTTSSSKKRSTLIPHAWFKALDKLPDDVAGRIYKAVQRLDITGEMTAFEEGSIEDVLFSQYAFQTDEFGQNYAQTCENRSAAAKKREAAKKHKKHNEAQANSFVDDRSGVDRIGMDGIGEDRSGGGGEDPAGTTTTTDLKEAIVEIWNSHDFVQKIRRVDNPAKRWERTEMAIAVAGGKQNFLELLRTLDQHAYLKNQPESGYSVIYDWFVDPENFQNILDGRYRDSRGDAKKYEGWEVVEFG